MLIDAGLSPRGCGSSRSPPLMGAIKHNNLEMVSLLLSAGADATQVLFNFINFICFLNFFFPILFLSFI
jgi:hypothetical protein